MIEINIYGASDDLIEVESTSFPNEEFNVWLNNSSDTLLLAVSDGTVLRVRYDEDGIWRFVPLVIGPSTDINIIFGKDDAAHTDQVTLIGDNLNWVVLGTHIAK